MKFTKKNTFKCPITLRGYVSKFQESKKQQKSALGCLDMKPHQQWAHSTPRSVKPCPICFSNVQPPTGPQWICSGIWLLPPQTESPELSWVYLQKLKKWLKLPLHGGCCPDEVQGKGWMLICKPAALLRLCTKPSIQPLQNAFPFFKRGLWPISRRNLLTFVAELQKALILPSRTFAFCLLKAFWKPTDLFQLDTLFVYAALRIAMQHSRTSFYTVDPKEHWSNVFTSLL